MISFIYIFFIASPPLLKIFKMVLSILNSFFRDWEKTREEGHILSFPGCEKLYSQVFHLLNESSHYEAAIGISGLEVKNL